MPFNMSPFQSTQRMVGLCIWRIVLRTKSGAAVKHLIQRLSRSVYIVMLYVLEANLSP